MINVPPAAGVMLKQEELALLMGNLICAGLPSPLARAAESRCSEEDGEGRCLQQGQDILRGAFQASCHHHQGQERATIVPQ